MNANELRAKSDVELREELTEIEATISYLEDLLANESKRRALIATELGEIRERIDLARPLRVCVDAGNGMAGELAPRIYRELGCEVTELEPGTWRLDSSNATSPLTRSLPSSTKPEPADALGVPWKDILGLQPEAPATASQ